MAKAWQGVNRYPRYMPVGTPMQCALPIDFYASERHFLDHLAPVWLALPAIRRGSFYVSAHLVEHAARRGVEAVPMCTKDNGQGPAVVAAYGDLLKLTKMGGERPLVLFEHGAGFTFGTKHTSYAGGSQARKWVSLFVVPNKYAERANKRTFHNAPQAVVGCPKLDAWHVQPAKPRGDPPVVAVSFHWDCKVAPETRSAFAHFQPALAQLAQSGYKVLGHGHPRIMPVLVPIYESLGIEVVRDFEDVLARADVYVNDASSTLYEFASLDRPVVVLNSPLYRRNVKFGLRFWEHSDVGVNCDDPKDLLGAIAEALRDSPEQQAKRKAAVDAAYKFHDGTAGQRAANAILEHFAESARLPFHPSEIVAPVRPGTTIRRGGETKQEPVLPVRPPLPAFPLPPIRSDGTFGVLYIAYGEPARAEVGRSIHTLKAAYPDMPTAVLSDSELPCADQTILLPDVEATAREYKTRTIEFSPWKYTLYLDADTRILGDLQGGFTALAAGWDMAAAIDFRPTLADVDHITGESLATTVREVGTPHVLHYNTGALFFRKSKTALDFYKLWHAEWERWHYRDQAAFLRALHKSKVKLWTLAPQWNTHIYEEALHVWHIHHVAAREGTP
jgi:hypothetical protein